MEKKCNATEFINKARQLHGMKYDYTEVEYVNSRTKVKIICPKHGVFEQLPSSHLQGNGCPKCAREWSDEHRRHHAESSRKSRGMTTEEWITRAREVHGDKYDYSRTIYVNQRTDVEIICPVHGVFTQKADSHLRGNGCRFCGYQSDGHKGKHGWTDEQRQKTAATCLDRYGATRYLDSDAGKAHATQIRSNPEFRRKMSEIISSDAVQEKTKETSLQRYGVSWPTQLPEIFMKLEETKRRNGTWSTSKPEERMYSMLCERFGKDDVERQYKESRYPFWCDFYIKSLDLFIELNATWLHGKHWFDMSNQDDVQQLDCWRNKVASGHRFYNVAIDVGTVRDVKKRRAAIDHDLNYVVFWKNDLSDFKQWIEADELQLKAY